MATLRLRDNFAENSWESGIASGIEEKDGKERKKRKKKVRRKSIEREREGQMPAKNRGLRISSTNGNACKKSQYASRQSLPNFFNNSLKLDKRAATVATAEWILGSYIHQVRIKRNGGKAIGSNRTKVVLFVVQCDQIWRQWETLYIPDRELRDLSISIRHETTLPKRLHSRAVTCELNDHRIKFASTATAIGRRGWDDNGHSPSPISRSAICAFVKTIGFGNHASLPKA